MKVSLIALFLLSFFGVIKRMKNFFVDISMKDASPIFMKHKWMQLKLKVDQNKPLIFIVFTTFQLCNEVKVVARHL